MLNMLFLMPLSVFQVLRVIRCLVKKFLLNGAGVEISRNLQLRLVRNLIKIDPARRFFTKTGQKISNPALKNS